jgi:hypothetical protein
VRSVISHLLAFFVAGTFAAGWALSAVIIIRRIPVEHWVMQVWLAVWITVTFIMGSLSIAIMLAVVAEFLSPVTGWHPLRRLGWVKVKDASSAPGNTEV